MKSYRKTAFRIATATVFVVPVGWTWLRADDPNQFGRSAGGYSDAPAPSRTDATVPQPTFTPTYHTVHDRETGEVRRIPMSAWQSHAAAGGFHSPMVQSYDSRSDEAETLRTKYLQTKDDAHRDQIKAELTALIEAQFESMHIDQAASIQSMKERLQRVESLHERRMQNREAIVQRRIEDLLGMPDHLRWTPPVTADFPPHRQLPSTSHAPISAWANDSFRPYADQRNNDLRTPTPQPPTRYVAPQPPSNVPWGNPPSPYNQPRPSQPSPVLRSSPPQLVPELPSSPAPAPAPSTVSSDQRVFDVLRDLASRRAKLEATVKQFEQAVELNQKGALPKSELDALQAEVVGLRQQLEVDERELKWIKGEVERDVARLEPLLEGDRSDREKIETEREIDRLMRLLAILKSNGTNSDSD
ncbi:HlyD family secretion protein [Rubripirellula reticaptiva]|uniref:Uncharacterized protein n=1 Tax=Rubripirellula reticaptiva TaxID=2528013 RepID=A0A5C6FD45_9BACT|nr:hypothetical protein [Rubripirellula reticaptiva]TWU57996.1 hypothetical protein Poly59_09050 [Rubripirellula reticaptiva]